MKMLLMYPFDTPNLMFWTVSPEQLVQQQSGHICIFQEFLPQGALKLKCKMYKYNSELLDSYTWNKIGRWWKYPTTPWFSGTRIILRSSFVVELSFLQQLLNTHRVLCSCLFFLNVIWKSSLCKYVLQYQWRDLMQH